MLRGSDRIVRHLEERLHVSAGETTADNKFTLVEAECLGSCGTAPMMQVGDDYYENLDEVKVDTIVTGLK
jgi:NADH-quinone oxidoreductase subunit E